jgi:hypothetical protein
MRVYTKEDIKSFIDQCDERSKGFKSFFLITIDECHTVNCLKGFVNRLHRSALVGQIQIFQSSFVNEIIELDTSGLPDEEEVDDSEMKVKYY